MASLVDTNILMYRYDPRSPDKQEIARELLRRGLADQELVLPHQAVVEFVAAATRPRSDLDGGSLLAPQVAYREAEILSEDFEHGRHYGSVRVVDPFLAAAADIHELPPMYDTAGP